MICLQKARSRPPFCCFPPSIPCLLPTLPRTVLFVVRSTGGSQSKWVGALPSCGCSLCWRGKLTRRGNSGCLIQINQDCCLLRWLGVIFLLSIQSGTARPCVRKCLAGGTIW